MVSSVNIQPIFSEVLKAGAASLINNYHHYKWPQAFRLGKWASTGYIWPNPPAFLSDGLLWAFFSATPHLMDQTLLGLGLLSSVVGPVGQSKVPEQILEVKAGDLSFILGNLSIKPIYWRAAPFRMTSLWVEHLMPIHQIKFCAPLNQTGGSTGAGNKQRFTSSGSISSRPLASLPQPLYWGDI